MALTSPINFFLNIGLPIYNSPGEMTTILVLFKYTYSGAFPLVCSEFIILVIVLVEPISGSLPLPTKLCFCICALFGGFFGPSSSPFLCRALRLIRLHLRDEHKICRAQIPFELCLFTLKTHLLSSKHTLWPSRVRHMCSQS